MYLAVRRLEDFTICVPGSETAGDFTMCVPGSEEAGYR
jgi:hypothetical protein